MDRLAWTRERPREAGWYWWLDDKPDYLFESLSASFTVRAIWEVSNVSIWVF